MVDKKQLEEVYKQNLENDIINAISEIKGIDLRKAFDIYYSSKLAEQISNDSYGIENLDAKYLAEDLSRKEHLVAQANEIRKGDLKHCFFPCRKQQNMYGNFMTNLLPDNLCLGAIFPKKLWTSVTRQVSILLII